MQDFCKKGAAKGQVCLPERCEKHQYLSPAQKMRVDLYVIMHTFLGLILLWDICCTLIKNYANMSHM